MATVSSVVTDHNSLSDADELEAIRQIFSTNLSLANRGTFLKEVFTQISDADMDALTQMLFDATGRELALTYVQPVSLSLKVVKPKYPFPRNPTNP